MSGLIVVDQGEEHFLDLVLDVNYTLRLHKNDPTGLSPEELDELTETDLFEANFPGYAASAITGGTWTTTPGNPTLGTNTERSFVRSSTGTAQNIWGYYLTRDSDGALEAIEFFDGPVSIEFINDQIDITPRITLGDTEENVNPTGSIIAYGADAAPTGWLLCDGSAVSRTTFADLFAVIGETYGVGDGSTTFNVPDLRQRFPLGKAASGTGATLGGTGGAIDHVHGLDTASSYARWTGAAIGGVNRQMQRKNTETWNATLEASDAAMAAGDPGQTTGTALGGDSDTENPPFQVVNFIIKT
ncbi:MAG: phage tail protein [Actinobacteria bacterium]|nr:phage tail protein [Actinomycetota bacterium]